MKKVLALVLVAVLAIGMGMSGFAYIGSNTIANITGFANNKSLIDGYNYTDNNNQYTTVSNLHTVNLGLIYAQDARVDYVDLITDMFKGGEQLTSINTRYDTVYYYLDWNFTKSTAFFHIAAPTVSSWDNMEKTLVENLARVYGVKIQVASTNQFIRYETLLNNDHFSAASWGDLYDQTPKGNTWTNTKDGVVYRYTIVSVLRNAGKDIPWEPAFVTNYDYAFQYLDLNTSLVRPKDLNATKYDKWLAAYRAFNFVLEDPTNVLNNVLYFYDVNGAYWSGKPLNNTTLTKKRNLSSEEIRQNNITVYTQIQEESAAVKEIEFLRGEGRIKIKWVTRFVSVDQKDFLLTIALNFNGRRDDDNALTFVGSVYNKELKIYASANSADISEGLIAIPVEFNSKIALAVGNGATVHTKLFKDKKYYCTTSRDSDEADDIVFRQYPDVDNVLTFYPVGVNNTGDYVTLSTDYDAYYVYDKDMNYLGRGNEQLQFSAKYYLANKRLDVDTEEEPDDDYETPSEVAPNPSTGGDGQAANNVNSNPGTGR